MRDKIRSLVEICNDASERGIDWLEETMSLDEIGHSIEVHIQNLDRKYEGRSIENAEAVLSWVEDLAMEMHDTKDVAWPTAIDIDAYCGIWWIKNRLPRKVDIDTLHQYSNRNYFVDSVMGWKRIENMPVVAKKERVLDAFTAKALLNYPSNGDWE